MKTSLRLGILGVALMGLVGISGCTTTSEEKDLLAQAAIQHATSKVIEAGSDPVGRAARVYDIATEARKLLGGETVTLPLLEKAVRERLTTENLSPADLALVDTLVRVISFELARQVGSEKLKPEQKLAVDKVLSWVIAAATLTQPTVVPEEPS